MYKIGNLISKGHATGKLKTYKLIKEEFKNESYLELPPYMRVPVARLRMSTHPLRIETSRYNLPMPIPAEECYCWFCQSSLVEDVSFSIRVQPVQHIAREKRTYELYCSLLNPAFSHLNNVDKCKYVLCAFEYCRNIFASSL